VIHEEHVVVIYAAKSTDDTRGSIDSQLQECREYAKRRNWRIDAEFSDEAASAFKRSRGPGLAQAKARAAELTADAANVVLLVYASDRLARGDGIDAPQLVEHFLDAIKAGYTLDAVTENLDNIVMVALGERAHVDSAAKSNWVKAGMRRRAERGKLNGGQRPYGYRWDNGSLVVVAHEAKIVRRVYREFIGGKSQRLITRDLNRERIPAARTDWHQGTVSAILKNPIYTGRVRLNGEIFNGEHKRIVNDDDWNAAQDLCAATARTKGGGRGRPSAGSHLLKGLLRCGLCGGAMVPRTIKARSKTGKPGEWYLCYSRVRDVEACSQTPVNRVEVDAAVYEFFRQVGLDMEATRRDAQTACRRAGRGARPARRGRAAGDAGLRSIRPRKARLPRRAPRRPGLGRAACGTDGRAAGCR
jgi:DNA invertase Pin-like site-specific DNA recombinase